MEWTLQIVSKSLGCIMSLLPAFTHPGLWAPVESQPVETGFHFSQKTFLFSIIFFYIRYLNSRLFM